MAKLYGWKETMFSVLILGGNVSLIDLLNALMFIFFLSGINLSIFLPLNPAIYRVGIVSNILSPRCKKPHSHFTFYCKLSKITRDYISEVI